MSLCVVQIPNATGGNRLQASTVQPCDGTLLLTAEDLDSHLTAYEVSLFIAGATTLYGLAFIFKLGRQTMGLR